MGQMDSMLILQMILMALSAVALYTMIGFIPGTDETSVLMPISLAIILAGTPPILVLTFFIAAIITLNLTNAIPTALVGLPGGVLSSPMIEHAIHLKNKGLSAKTIKKMAAGSLIGVIISVPTALVIANILAPFAEDIQRYASLLFVIGAVFLSLIGKNKILALLSIVPLALLFMSLRHLYWGTGVVPPTKTITTSFFLGITIGPLLVSLLSLLNKKSREALVTSMPKSIRIPTNQERGLNPFKIINKRERWASAIPAFISNFLFVLSPVGLTILLGETAANREEEPTKKATLAITSMSALAQSTYLSGIIIPLIALGIPLSPTAIGPGSALFNADPVFSIDRNIHHLLNRTEFVFAILIGAIIACGITYVITNRYASKIASFVLYHIPHEAILGLFIALILLLSYMDAGLINVFGVLLIGVVCGTLNKMGVNYGVQFMTLYAAPWLIEQLSRLS
jgi:putative tricarboxylic transport membrane protein